MENDGLKIIDLSVTEKETDKILTADFIQLIIKRSPYYKATAVIMSPHEVRIKGEGIRLTRFMIKVLRDPEWLKKVGHIKYE